MIKVGLYQVGDT